MTKRKFEILYVDDIGFLIRTYPLETFPNRHADFFLYYACINDNPDNEYIMGAHLLISDLKEALKEFKATHKQKFSIEQKKHICSAIDKWWEPVRSIDIYGGFESTKDEFLEQLKCMICDTKVGEFIDD